MYLRDLFAKCMTIIENMLIQCTALLQLLGTMCSCALHRRHLMVWKVFGPRFLFASLQLLLLFPTTAALLLVTCIFLWRLQCWHRHSFTTGQLLIHTLTYLDWFSFSFSHITHHTSLTRKHLHLSHAHTCISHTHLHLSSCIQVIQTYVHTYLVNWDATVAHHSTNFSPSRSGVRRGGLGGGVQPPPPNRKKL